MQRAMGRTSHPSGKIGKEVIPIVKAMDRDMRSGEWWCGGGLHVVCIILRQAACVRVCVGAMLWG